MLVIAHRGHCAAYPENTALAFEAAIAAGADLIETDVRLTRDGHPVCWHDPDLRRITGDARAVSELSLNEFRRIALPRGQAPLTLEQVLTLASGRVRVMLDVKLSSTDMLRAIVAALAATRMTGQVMYGVRHPVQYAELQLHAPSIAALAMPDPDAADTLGEHLAACVAAVRLWEPQVTPERIGRIRAAGRQTWVTAGDRDSGEPAGFITPGRIRTLEQLGIDALLVNNPSQAIASRAKTTPTRKAHTS